MTIEQPQERSTAGTGGPAPRPGIARGSRLGRLLLLPVLAGMALLGPGTAQATGTWQTDTPSLVPVPFGLAATTAPCPSTTAGTPSTSTCLYAIGGGDSRNTALSSVEYYDPSTGTGGSWHSVPSLATARRGLGATTAPCPSPSTGTCLYAIGGDDGSNTYLSSVECYAPGTGTSGSWQSAPALVTARRFLGAAVAPCPSPSTGNCLYAIGGRDSSTTTLSSVEYYAPTTSPTLALLSQTHLLRSHSRLVVSWHLADRSGVVGFRVYAARQQLTAHLIPIHASPRYRAVFQTQAVGSVRVHVLRTDGTSTSIAVH